MPSIARHHTLLAAAVLAALGLAACGGGPDLAAGSAADTSRARGLLVAAAADGPVPLEVDSVPPGFAGGVAEVASLASERAAWLGARFIPTPFGAGSDRRRLVFRFEDKAGAPEQACAGGPAPRGVVPPPPAKLTAIFCDGPRPVADVTGTASGAAPEDTDRLVAATVDRLFPGRNGGDATSGFPGVSLGVGIGTGGRWGLGGGLRF
jgi:ABC-type amino acid transport substrate-binding protein